MRVSVGVQGSPGFVPAGVELSSTPPSLAMAAPARTAAATAARTNSPAKRFIMVLPVIFLLYTGRVQKVPLPLATVAVRTAGEDRGGGWPLVGTPEAEEDGGCVVLVGALAES